MRTFAATKRIMSTLRFKAVEEAFKKKALDVQVPARHIADYYAKYVFTASTMAKYLSKDVVNAIQNAVKNGETLDRSIADDVAAGMKQWAMELGATHYTHWFQPLTDGTAQKHDSFIDYVAGPAKRLSRIFQANCLHSRNRMHHHSRTEVSAAHSRHAVIQHGIHLRRLSSWMTRCASRQSSFPIRVNRST